MRCLPDKDHTECFSRRHIVDIEFGRCYDLPEARTIRRAYQKISVDCSPLDVVMLQNHWQCSMATHASEHYATSQHRVGWGPCPNTTQAVQSNIQIK